MQKQQKLNNSSTFFFMGAGNRIVQNENLILLDRESAFFLLDIEVDMKNNKEQDEEQSIENSMHENSSHTCFHVHKTDGLILPWDLQDYPW